MWKKGERQDDRVFANFRRDVLLHVPISCDLGLKYGDGQKHVPPAVMRGSRGRSPSHRAASSCFHLADFFVMLA
jgi:hypothetical protein